MSVFNIADRSLEGGVLFNPFNAEYFKALETETEFGARMGMPALTLPAHLVQSGDRTFQSLCRTALWLKRQIKDKDTSKEARRRMADTLDLVEFNIEYMKTHRKECEAFVQHIADNLWDKGATVAEARGWN